MVSPSNLILRFAFAFTFLVGAAHAGAADPKARPVTPQEAEFFESRIRPVLTENCFGCHGQAKQKAGLRLDSLQALLQGGDNGPVVLPGDPENSRLILAIRYSGELKMPPKGKLPPPAVEALTTWVRMGAPWPQTKNTLAGTASTEAWKRHWAFQPVRRPDIPETNDQTWPQSALD